MYGKEFREGEGVSTKSTKRSYRFCLFDTIVTKPRPVNPADICASQEYNSLKKRLGSERLLIIEARTERCKILKAEFYEPRKVQ